MPANFLHGVEVIETTIGPLPITVVKSAVIGLVGSAPMFAVSGALPLWNGSTVTLVGARIIDAVGNVQICTTAGTTGTTIPTFASTLNTTTSDGTVTWTMIQTAASLGLVNNPVLVNSGLGGFGPRIQGYTIPYALWAIQQQGAGQTIVINVFDQTVHFSTLAAATFTFPASGTQAISVGHMGLWNLKITNTGATTTYINGTDYTVDLVNGVILQKTGGAMTSGQTAKVTCNYADPSQVSDSNLVGTISGSIFTGMQAFLLTYNTMGFFPRMLIAPMFGTGAGFQAVGSGDLTVAAAMQTMCGKFRALYYVDAAPNTPVATAISNRGLSSSPFDRSDVRGVLCHPQHMFFDTGIVPTGVTVANSGVAVQNLANANVDGPFSPWVVGAQAAKDFALGYWWSVSNTPIIGLIGPDIQIYSSAQDPNADVQNLNAAGIVTSFNAFGTGLRVWGNRSSAYPTDTAPDNFMSVRRTMDIVEDSVELFAMAYVDNPINNALITAILQAGNAFIRSLIARGALVGGSVTYNPSDNPPSQLAAGQIVFELQAMPPPPAERITFESFININLLSSLGTGANATQVPANA